jgi:hypothetical protein
MKIKMDISGIFIPIKKKGIMLHISENDGSHQGRLVINQRYLKWRKRRVTWPKFMEYMNQKNTPTSRRKRNSNKNRSTPKNWKPHEIRKLRSGYKIRSASQLASELKRSFPSVRGKIAALGLRKR